MAWSDPFFSLIQSRAEAVHGMYSLAMGPLSSLIDSLEALIESPAEDLARNWAAVRRFARNFSWSDFSRLLSAQNVTKRTRIQGLRLRIQNCVEELLASPVPSPALSEKLVQELHLVLNELRQEEQLSIQSCETWSSAFRTAGAMVGGTSIVGMLFLLCWSGLTTSRSLTLLPLPVFDARHSPDRARQVITKAIAQNLTRDGHALPVPSALSVGPGRPNVAPPANQSWTQLFDGAWQTEILNSSHLWSEYIGSVVCELELVSPKPFPWDEVFPNERINVALHFDPDANKWWIENHGRSPVLVNGDVCANLSGGVCVAETRLKTLTNVVLRSGDTCDANSEETRNGPAPAPPQEATDAPTPPEEHSPPRVETTPTPPAASPIKKEEKPSDRPAMPAACNLKAELTIETITGNIVVEHLDADIVFQKPTRTEPAPNMSAPAADFSTMVAAMLGKAPTRGDDNILVVAPIDLRGIQKNETRSFVMTVNKSFSPRGCLAVRAECHATVSGIYKLSTFVNGRQINTMTCELIGTDLNFDGNRLLSVDVFRLIQRGMQDVLEYKGRINSKAHGRRSRNVVRSQSR